MPLRPDQLPLPFAAARSQTFLNFSGHDNDELVSRLGALPHGFAVTWLHGPDGVGKTHLLQAALHAQQGFGLRGRYVEAALAGADKALDGCERCAIVAVDDAGAWIGRRAEEIRLFALYQALQVRGGQLVLADRLSPLALHFALPDLASRLRAAQVFEVQALDESGIRRLLQRRTRERGLQLARPVLDYWLTRRSRALTALLHDLDRLDAAAWRDQRRLTVPFLKSVLGI